MGRQTREHEAHAAQERLQQAIACKRKHKLQDAPPVAASCAVLGSKYGVGIGLYFKIIAWLRWLLFWLALCMVPFMIVANTARFTTPEHKGEAGGPGMSTLPSFNILQSLTFAVLPDDEADQGLLSWMNIQLPGFQGVFPMSRAFFLAWISFMDAGSMAVFSVACLALYKLASRFAKAVDESTMEVADYTVLVKGLPETTPIDIGHHFSKWGRVVDVVMVKDFGSLLNLAATATSLEQQRKAAENKVVSGRRAAARQQKIKKMEHKMVSFMQQANQQLDSSGFELKAVFVTFNTQGQAQACLAACPRRWLSSWLQRRKDKFLGKYRFWVEQAKPPEDYIYENLSVPRLSRYLRMGFVRLVVFAILLASAGAVTKLMAMNMEAARSVVWDNAAMDSMINLNMRVWPLNSTEAMLAPAAANETLARIAAAVGPEAASQLAVSSNNQVAYCSINLEQACSTGFSRMLGASLSMQGGLGVTWTNLSDSLLKREQFLQQLPACTKPGSGCTSLAMCYPCHCSMLSKVAAAKVSHSDWVLAMRQECGGLIQTLDIHAYIMKGLISMVLVLLNFLLKAVLQLLVDFEKHWTQSDKERAYAILAFVSQLLNSVLVLLLVNAQSSVASAVINGLLNSGTASRYTSWGANLILSGAYTDFSPSWYIDVGQSLQLLIIINALVTGAFTLAMWIKRKMQQCALTTCMQGASQSSWNAAWIGMAFVLDARVSDIMLGMWIILMFGSGIPSLYVWGLIWLLVVEVADRWSLARICQTPARYGKSLPFLLLGVLPCAAATHCAFGLWQHTRFQAGHRGDQQINGLASSAGANAEALTNNYYFQRMTQTNGLPLLVLLIVHLTMHIFIRFMLYFFGKAFTTFCGCCGCKDADEAAAQTPAAEVTYEAALLARHAQNSGSGGGAAGKASGNRPGPGGTPRSDVALAGAPTYRLPHHPRYSEIFSNPLYKPVWFKAFGRLRYTTLLSRPGGGFIIAPEPILDHDQSDMEQSLSSVSSDLQAMALRMADDKGVEGTGKRKRASGLLTAELQAMRDRSMTVQVAVLAGLGIDSPGGSFTGPQAIMGGGARHQSLDLAGRAAAAGAAGATQAGSLSLLAGPAAASVSSFSQHSEEAASGVSDGGSFNAPAVAVSGQQQARLSWPGGDQHHLPAGVYAAVAADLAAGAAAAAAAANTRSTADLCISDNQQADAMGTFGETCQEQQQSGEQQQQQEDCWPDLPLGITAEPFLQCMDDNVHVALDPATLPAQGLVSCQYPVDDMLTGPAAGAGPGAAAGDTRGPEPVVTMSGGIESAAVEIELLPLPAEHCNYQHQHHHADYNQDQGQTLQEQPDAPGSDGSAANGAVEEGADSCAAGAAAWWSDSLRQQARLQSRAEAIFGPAVAGPAGPMAAAAAMQSTGAADSSRSSAASCFAFGLPLPPTMCVTPEQQEQHQRQQQQQQQQDAYFLEQQSGAFEPLKAAAAGVLQDACGSATIQLSTSPNHITDGRPQPAVQPGWMCGSTNTSLSPGFNLWGGAVAAATATTSHAQGSHDASGGQPTAAAVQPHPSCSSPCLPRTALPTFFPQIQNLPFAAEQPPPAFPNVHLTTVEMPAGFMLPADPAAKGGSFTAALLAGGSRSVQEAGQGGGAAADQQQLPPTWLQPQAQQDAAAAWVAALSNRPADAALVPPQTVVAVGDTTQQLALELEEVRGAVVANTAVSSCSDSEADDECLVEAAGAKSHAAGAPTSGGSSSGGGGSNNKKGKKHKKGKKGKKGRKS